MADTTIQKVLIIGAGIAGLTLAQCLRKQNTPFTIYEPDGVGSAVRPFVLRRSNSEVFTGSATPVFETVTLRGEEMEGQLRLGYTGFVGFGEGSTLFNGGWYDALILGDQLPPVNRVLLIGDACHPMTPNRGEGDIFAIRDAMQLSRLLAENFGWITRC
ncbi:hypothetical protein B0T18DRAFT_433020 [Schizothecium vesticola]|uniref:FAD-binding domain-containing protein n=1 Tax=Schizothecium vesticola TaxID=314040 RepID=A0AA40BPQ7_9PEZI|nr:hypothetical protein B0T18DRAFT_433020 [Schizothecium vesticola]